MPLETNIKPPNPTVLQNFSFFVLGLVALIKLIFLAVAHMMLCFGFVTNTVLIRHQCFRYCQTVFTQQQQGLLCFSHYPLPYGIILSNKSWGNEEGKTVAFQVFVFPSNPYVWWALFSWSGWTPASWWEVLSECLVLLYRHMHLCITSWNFYISQGVFSLLLFFSSSPILLEVEEGKRGRSHVMLSCLPRLNCNILLEHIHKHIFF